MNPQPPHEPELIRRAVQARAQRAAARSQLLAAAELEGVPVRVVAQHDWSRRRAALAVAAANVLTQVLVRVLL